MEKWSFEQLKQLEEIGDVLSVAEEYDIPLDGCDGMDEMIERLSLHKSKLLGLHKAIMEDQNYEAMKRENMQKRTALLQIYESVRKSLNPAQRHLQTIFSAGGISETLGKDFGDHMTAVNSGECFVVISGETGAGKSTLLNLLLGVEILPSSILSCTSMICKLRYGSHYSARLIYTDRETEVFHFQDHNDAFDSLDKIIFIQGADEREKISSVKEIQIFLPASILKSGITIVDTPGISENETMDSVVRTFVANNCVSAFIYVIKTDNAGGVQEDRLLRFLKVILDQKNRSNPDQPEQFNPNAAMFVCHRWDLIEDEEKEKVQDNAVKKLKDVWPGLDSSQVCFFSTLKAQAHLDVDKDYLTFDMIKLLRGLQELSALAMTNSIEGSYCWLRQVVKQSSFYMKTIISRIKTTDQDLREKFETASDKLVALRSRADATITELQRQLETESSTIKVKIKSFLKTRNIKDKLSKWDREDIPEAPRTDTASRFDSGVINKESDNIIIKKIFEHLDSWERTVHFASSFRDKMTYVIKEKLHLLDEDMHKITEDLQENSSLSSSASSTRSSFSATNEDDFSYLLRKRVNESVMDRIRNIGVRPIHFISRAIVSRILGPLVDSVIRQKSARRSSVFSTDPESLMTHRAHKILDAMTNNDEMLNRVVSRYTDQFVDQIECIAKNIPKFIQVNEKLMNEIKCNRSEFRRNENELRSAMEMLEPQKEFLRGFGCLYVKEIASDDILFTIEDPRLGSTKVKVDLYLRRSTIDAPNHRRDATLGLWALYQKGNLTVGDEEEAITFRAYINEMPDQHLFREIAKLRILEHTSVSTFIGMTRVENQSAFIFLGHLTSARRFLRRTLVDVRQAVPTFLEGTVEGLQYLHSEGLVHMELTTDTAMVNQSGDVKLCGGCIPRKAKYPLDKDSVEAGEFTCLSPEVLKGSVYTSEADIYSFGIIVWEVLLQERPYSVQRRWPLSRFINQVHPSAMLKLPEDVSECLSQLLRGCLLPGPALRLPLTKACDLVKMLRSDSIITNLRNRPSPRHYRDALRSPPEEEIYNR